MEVVGLDLSLTSTGISLPIGEYAIQVKTSGPARLVQIETRIQEYLEPLDNPFVLLEGYSYGSKNTQAHKTGELGGVVRRMLYLSQIPYIEVPPTCRAKFATGKGNAGKSEVVSAISAKTGIVWSGSGADDMCDAFLLRQIGLTKLGFSEYEWNKANLEALEKVDWTSWIEAGIIAP